MQGSRTKGQATERRALDHLQNRGLRLRTANYHCRASEIDLIMCDGATLVFVKVRQRSNPRFGGALASIDAAKRRRLIATASHYLQHTGMDMPSRFDVVAIDAAGTVDWIADAFSSDTA